jgi:TonB family protein
MKNIFTFLLFISVAYSLFGQDTLYFDDEWNKTKSLKVAAYYKIVEKNKDEQNQITERTYFKSGQIKYETQFSYNNKDEKTYNGLQKSWYESGELRFASTYSNGKKNGDFLSYWKNGILKRKDFYKNGKLKKGECWNENGEKVEYYDFEIHPKYPGGKVKMYEFIKKNLKYPPLSKQYNLGGKVVIGFKINTDGNVSDLKVIEGVNSELDTEAIRIIKNMPKWEPGYQDGIAVPVKYTIPIIFQP